MKKFLLMITLCLLINTNPSYPISYADNVFWAKVQTDNAYFYAQSSETSPLFILPTSYFVKLSGEENYFYKAEYNTLQGYVKKSDVVPMDGTPANPFFSDSFRVFLPSGTPLYATSEMNDNLAIDNIPYLYDELIFYGSITGQTAIPDKSNLWHYCKFKNEFGYVYSTFCDKLSSPPLNNESFEIIQNLSFKTSQKANPLSSTAMTFIIIGVSLPCLIVLYLLMKPSTMKASLPRKKEKYKSQKRRDYFEFDQSDLY